MTTTAPFGVVAALGLLLGGCGVGREDGPEPDTARFSWGDRTFTVPLAECGREDDVVILAGELDGMVVQVAADLGEDGMDRTGVTADLGPDDGTWGAFGADLEQGPAGEIRSVEADGDRLIVEGRWVRFDDDLVPQPHPAIDGKLVARCPATETA